MPLGSIYRPFLALCREARIDVLEILQSHGFTEAQLLEANTRISRERSRQLAKSLFDALGDPLVGLRAAERFDLEDADLFGYMLKHSATTLDALEQIVRYVRLIGDSADARVELVGRHIVISAGLQDGEWLLPPFADLVAGLIVRGVFAATKVRPIEVQLARPTPKRIAPYASFFGARLVFESSHNVVTYEEVDLRRVAAGSESRLFAILRAHADDALAKLPLGSSFSARVRAAIAAELGRGQVELPSTARALGVSERTLRRRLSESGESYRSLLDEARAERAVALLREGTHSVTKVAHDLGFADTSSFARAFRRWTGKSPTAYARPPADK